MGAGVSCRCSCRDGTQVVEYWTDEAIPVVDTPMTGEARAQVLEKQGRCGPHANKSFGRPSMHAWGLPGKQVIVDCPLDTDPSFMRTVAPSGTSWGQYVRTRTSFIDPRTGALAGPWAECVAWAVIFDRITDRCDLVQQVGDTAWSAMKVLEKTLIGNPDKPAIMLAARKVEAAAKRLMEENEPMPLINQVLPMPDGACPGHMLRTENPQTPGTYIILQVPPFSFPGQLVLTPAPIQPNRRGSFRACVNDSLRLGGQPAIGSLVCKAHTLSSTPLSWQKNCEASGDESILEWSSEGSYQRRIQDDIADFDVFDALEAVGEFSALVADDAGDVTVKLF